MTILRERMTWRRTRTEPKTRYATLDLTPEKREHVRVAFRALRRRYGSDTALAEALQSSQRSLTRVMGTKGKPGAVILLRAAKLAKVLERQVAEGWRVPPVRPVRSTGSHFFGMSRPAPLTAV